jgi:hypothetical protein
MYERVLNNSKVATINVKINFLPNNFSRRKALLQFLNMGCRVFKYFFFGELGLLFLFPDERRRHKIDRVNGLIMSQPSAAGSTVYPRRIRKVQRKRHVLELYQF